MTNVVCPVRQGPRSRRSWTKGSAANAAAVHEASAARVVGLFPIALGLIVIAGLLLRWAIIASPLGWIDADEAIVGLMARHIVQGERPGFYWGLG